MKTKRLDIHIIARVVALYSFALGILIVFCNFEQPQLLSEDIGLLYVITAFLLNALLLALLFITVLISPSKVKEVAKSIGILLINIPIAIGCITLTFYVSDFERITFVNVTGSEITDVKLTGAYSKEIGTISNVATFEEWIYLGYGDHLLLTYKKDGNLRTETIFNDYYSSMFKGRSYYYIEKQ